MSANKVKDVMIPVEEYVTVREDVTLLDLFLALEADRESKKDKTAHAHRDVLVVNAAGDVVGKVTMLDILRTLEPGYNKIKATTHGTLTVEYVSRVFEDLDLWAEPITDICAKNMSVTIKEVMHVPTPKETIAEDANLERAVHHYVMGVHQPMLVTKAGKVTGVVRLGDIFETIRSAALTCKG